MGMRWSARSNTCVGAGGRTAHLVPVVLLLLVCAAGGLRFLLRDAALAEAGGPVASPARHGRVPASPEGLLAPPVAQPSAADRGTPPARAEARPSRMICLRREGRRPLAGISAFGRAGRLAGPSADDGALELQRAPGEPLTIWAAGWSPVFVRSHEETPEVVLLDPCSARLEVQLVGMEHGDEVLRSLLQPRGYHATEQDPWQPALVPAGPYRLAAGELPTGDYDVYVWVTGPRGTRSLAAPAVAVAESGTVTLELDAGVASDSDPDS